MYEGQSLGGGMTTQNAGCLEGGVDVSFIVIIETLPEVVKLSLEEKRQLADELFDEVEGSTHNELRPVIVALLNARMEQYQRDPSSAKPWSEVRKAINLSS